MALYILQTGSDPVLVCSEGGACNLVGGERRDNTLKALMNTIELQSIGFYGNFYILM